MEPLYNLDSGNKTHHKLLTKYIIFIAREENKVKRLRGVPREGRERRTAMLFYTGNRGIHFAEILEISERGQ